MPAPRAPLSEDLRRYLGDSYPHNHTYRVRGARLIPKRQLRKRFEAIQRLYPDPLTSLLDVGCSKGWFVLAAAGDPACLRALGIDVHARDIAACRAVAAHTGSRARFERLELHRLAERLDELGGPFQTVLLVNCYQYLYFGGDRCDTAYLDHGRLFGLLRRVCSGRVIFNNRTELDRLQAPIQARAAASGQAAAYHSGAIREAAEQHFTVTDLGTMGRYPLWLLEVA